MELTAQSFFVASVTVLDAVAIYRALWRTQGAERTLMWIFAILAFPGVGALAFFLLANPSVTRAKLKKLVASKLIGESRPPVPHHVRHTGDTSILALASGITGLPPTRGNLVEITPEPPENFPLIEVMLRRAERSIWVEFYIIQNDETGKRFMRELAAAAQRGVEVKVLYDALGSLGMSDEAVLEVQRAGAKIEAFHPLSPWRRKWSVHLRNHRKLVIVDGREALTGSMNVGNEYSWRFLKRGAARFRDINLRVTGPAVHDFCHVFAEDWYFAVGEQLEIPFAYEVEETGSGSVAVIPSGPDQTYNASALLFFGGIATATERVLITTPYFIPDEPLNRALQFAALRGVDVRLLVPARPDAALVGPAGRSYFPDLLKAGVRIYEYLPTMLHAKSMVIDSDYSLVGSANLDVRSMRLNFELGILVADRGLNERLTDRFHSEQQASREVTTESLARRGAVAQALEKLARLLSPML